MKKIVLAFVACFAIQVFALTEGDYTYTVSNGEATITSFSKSVSGAIEIPSTLGGYPVTSIGRSAFYDCSSLTSVVIPEGVTNIGNYAFSSCSGLTSVVIPEGVTSIGRYAFRGCSGLTSVVIPEGVTSIGDLAFYDCSGLTSVVIPEGVTSIGSFEFGYCSSLTSVVIPEGVTSIGSSAFYGCSGLTSVVIPEGVTSIGSYAFECCSSLTSVVIPNSVTSIGNYAFSSCSGLAFMTFLGGVPNGYSKAGISSNTLLSFPQKYAQNWEKVLGNGSRGAYAENLSSAQVDVKTEMLTPKTMKVTYKVTGVKNADAKVKTRVVAFKDGVRSFANIVPVKSGTNVPNGDVVEANGEHSFTWNVSEDWDSDLAKVKVEILVQEGQLLPQELITIPANGENKAMTITRNSITEDMAFNALLWCYAEGDAKLTNEDGIVKYNGVQIAYQGCVSEASADAVSSSEGTFNFEGERETDQTVLLNYLYGKMGYKVLSGNLLKYAEQMTRCNFADSNDDNWNENLSQWFNGKYGSRYINHIRQIAVKIEE